MNGLVSWKMWEISYQLISTVNMTMASIVSKIVVMNRELSDGSVNLTP